MERFGITTQGKVLVFSKEKQIKDFTITDYWFTVGKKDDQGNWENKSMNLVFRKDDDKPDHNEEIVIEDGFFILKGKGSYQQIAIMVMEWDYAGEEPAPTPPPKKRKKKGE